MKTLLRFWVFEEGDIRTKNLPFALFILVVVAGCVCGVATLLGWWFSSGVEFEEGTPMTKIWYVRLLFGCFLLGIANVIAFVSGLFILALKAPFGD